MGNLHFGISIRPWNRTVDLYASAGHIQAMSSRRGVAQRVVFVEPETEGMEVDPMLTMGLEDAQSLFDELWRNGFRSSKVLDEAARIDSVKAHLEDMRAIAFDRLKMQAPAR